MSRLLVLALAVAASNAFAAMPATQLADGEEFMPACNPLGVPFEPQCWFGGDIVN